MPEQSPISHDAVYLKLDAELRDLRKQREKARPAVYLLLAILLGFLGLALPVGWALLAWLFALASLLAALTALANGNRLGGQIRALLTRISLAETAPPSAPPQPSADVSVRLAKLQGLLEQKLITEEEFDRRRTAILDEI